MSKDKRKENTLKEVRKKVGLQMQDRRRFLSAIMEVESGEKSIEAKQDHIRDMKVQVGAGVTEKDQFGNTITKEQLQRTIVYGEFQLKGMRLGLDYKKEDLYFILHGVEGIIDKVGDLDEAKKKIRVHIDLMREEYDRIKKVMHDVV